MRKIGAALTLFIPLITGASATPILPTQNLASDSVATQLGWVPSTDNLCGGYYLEAPFTYPVSVEKQNLVEVTGNQAMLSQKGTSTLEGKVTVTREGQQMTANKAYLYRDPTTGKLSAIDMVGNVHLREPNTLVVGKQGHYDFATKSKSLMDILYRSDFNGQQFGVEKVSLQASHSERKITSLTAWGSANTFSQSKPKVYELTQSTFSTCPPIHPFWHLKASHIVLNKEIGRGYATNARLYVKNTPIFYSPYFSFSIDNQRKSGFLVPRFGPSNKWGPYIQAPFYWNMAPNYDMTITPGLLSQRGFQLSDTFRYLTPTSDGHVSFSVLPQDKAFKQFQQATNENPAYTQSISPSTQAELSRLLGDSTTRKAFIWRDDSRYNDHWSSHVDYNYVGDDYYLQDFGDNLREITQNQLLQEADLYYKGQNWNFTGRIQAYQTLNPINDTVTPNQYRRLPQLVLAGDYPDQALGLEYFINNDLTHFDILNTPGVVANLPIGNRFHTQPGVSLPLYWPSFYINPRFQVALTDYNLYQTTPTGTPDALHRALPIFDIASGVSFTRDANLFGEAFQQTLEPQVYYEYIPYRNQTEIPLFDTTVNTLTYDQLFNYNRFSGIDRIGDANQVGVGVTSRFIDQASGFERVRLAVGDIVYFADRRVTLCNDPNVCTDNPENPANHYSLSPISGVADYHVNPYWRVTANPIWDPITRQLDNAIFALQYQLDAKRLINLSFNYAHNGDILTGLDANTSRNNLKLTDVSGAWPVSENVSVVGRWSQDWNLHRLQNLIYGVQYDSCCWAIRLVGTNSYTGLDPNNNNKLKYDSQYYVEFNLKGLGDISTGNPGGALSTILGYHSQFG